MGRLSEIYDMFAATYHKNRGLFDVSAILAEFDAVIPGSPGRLLDLGCGAGEPVGRYFLDRGWTVTGVDFSAQMLELTSQYTPEMEAIHADMRRVAFPENSFEAITAFYSLFHLPSKDHLDLFRRMHSWLSPSGVALFTYATEAYTGSPRFDGTKEFLGQPLYYGHKTVPELFRDLEEAKLSVISAVNREVGGETFLWVTVKSA